ncbi:MAG: alpha/beta fold hydrolase [Vicingaceae bacterium]|nr:alpha/beta fold hydrolase [Vicingaceae bacterium]
MQLNYKKIGEGQPLIILHGLFGSLDNWMTLSKKLGEQFEVYIVDARNHGFSPHSDEFNYEVMADDLLEFINEHNIIDPIVLGHSMGGKTAMQFAMNYPDKLSKLIIADIAPKPYPVHHGIILEGMFALDFDKITSRRDADEELAKHIPDFSTRQFILKNLFWKEKGKLAWKFNLPVINDNIEMVGFELNNITPFNKPTLFIRGTKSNYILESDYPKIKSVFTNTKIKNIESGHWVHAENPSQFLEILNIFLN